MLKTEYSLMASIYLMLAILLEVAGTTSMKLSEGFTRLGPSLFIFVFLLFFFYFFDLIIKTSRNQYGLCGMVGARDLINFINRYILF
jgi:hypothetical protein